jgi:outer membrane protein TolC
VWVSALAAAGCSAESHARRAELMAERLLEERGERVLGTREATAREPALRAPEEQESPPAGEERAEGEGGAAPEAPPGGAGAPAPRVLDLRSALAIAYATSRQMLDRKEALHLQALSLASVRHDFAPQLALTLAYLFDAPPGPDANSGNARFTASQILPTGARLDLTASTGVAAQEGLAGDYDSLVSLSLAQPLLRGGGHAVTHEPLIQAERDLVYAIREFELFREDFSIDVARRFYDLVNQKQSIDNQRRNFESNELARRQAEALFAVGRAKELDVLRARRSELNARNDLLEAEESLQLALDNFRIFLGLPEDEPVDVEPDAPEFTEVAYDERSAIEVAMENRLDLRNRREQLEDVERGLRLARNALLPDLGLTLGTTYATSDPDSLGGSDPERSDTSLALTLGVPLDRVRERNAYRASELGLARARRGLEQFEDELRVSIRSSFRELERRLQSLEIQRILIEDQTKNVRIAELRFERGELPNRDVVEANQALLDAENALIDEQVNYEIARLRLLRDLGILFVDDSGMWKR